MDQIIIHGGRRLKGEVRTSGAKNAALPILASTILGGGECVLSNMPSVVDVLTMGKLLRMLGIAVAQEGEHTVVDAQIIASTEAPYDLVRTMRASVLVLGPLVARMGEAKVSLPGGCAIGSRPVNFHLAGLEKMGATVEIEHGYIKATARRLRGSRIYFDTPSVTGTENLMMAACLAEGDTVIENAAREPEVVELGRFLQSAGAQIEGLGTSVIRITGAALKAPRSFRICADRIETGTWIAIAAATRSALRITETDAAQLESVLAVFRQMGLGVDVQEQGRVIQVTPADRYSPVEVETEPFPGFATDMQAQLMAALCLADGTSRVKETIFENRFMHVAELRRLGAQIDILGNEAVIHGPAQLRGAPIMATDLRASASLVIAALGATGESRVSRIYHLDRGYQKLDRKLASLGARIQRIQE